MNGLGQCLKKKRPRASHRGWPEPTNLAGHLVDNALDAQLGRCRWFCWCCLANKTQSTATNHSKMAAAIASALGAVTAKLLSWAQLLLGNMARLVVLRIFSSITTGRLVVTDELSGTMHVLGRHPLDGDRKAADKNVPCSFDVELIVKRNAFWLRLLFFADIGFAEAYMLGDVECNDLPAFFQVCMTLIHQHARGPRFTIRFATSCSSGTEIILATERLFSPPCRQRSREYGDPRTRVPIRC